MGMNWAASGRRDDYTFCLVDPVSLVETGETVDVVEGGTITFATSADNRVTASLGLHNASTDRMIRIKHTITLPGGYQHGETLATLFVDGESAQAQYHHSTRDVSLYSSLLRATADVCARDFARPAGTNIIGEIRDLLETDGGKLRVLQGVDANRTHTVPVWWEVGTKRSKVLDDLAMWTGCEYGVDEDGYITWGRYIEPANRPLAFVFEDGENCVYKDGYQLDYGADDTYNRVVAHFARQSKQDDPSKENYDPYPLSDSVYVDLPATHPYSYERLGRRKAYDLKVSDPCDHASLTAMAQRKLNEVSSSDHILVIEHVSVPGLREGNLVQYINSTDPQMVPLYSVYAIVEEIQMELGRGCMCKTKLRCL